MIVSFEHWSFNVPEYPQYEDIPHVMSNMCNCGKSGIANEKDQTVIGFSMTSSGYMVIFECDVCFEKYRYHINTAGRYNLSEFKNELGLIMFNKLHP